MTAPPGDPYGQDPSGPNPSGPNPSGPNPSGPNPYGQEPYWGGPPPGGQYPYPPGGQYPYPPQQYPPQQYPPQQYPPQQYPQAGQQYPPGGWPGGPYPSGPPPNGPRSKLPWLIVAGVAVLGVIALAVIVVVGLTKENKPTQANPAGPPTTSAPSSINADQSATDCTPNVSGGEKPPGDTIAAGKLSFLATAAPGWSVYSDDQNPNLIGALGVSQTVPGASQWAMSAEVAVTNFVASMDISAQASKLMQCVANGPGYSNASPTLGPMKTSSTTVDGVKAARVDADITIADTSKGVKGDSVVIIAVNTKPVTVFLGGTPIGDAASAAIVNQVIAALKVTKS